MPGWPTTRRADVLGDGLTVRQVKMEEVKIQRKNGIGRKVKTLSHYSLGTYP